MKTQSWLSNCNTTWLETINKLDKSFTSNSWIEGILFWCSSSWHKNQANLFKASERILKNKTSKWLGGWSYSMSTTVGLFCAKLIWLIEFNRMFMYPGFIFILSWGITYIVSLYLHFLHAIIYQVILSNTNIHNDIVSSNYFCWIISIFCTHLYGFKYSYLTTIICKQLYGFK